MRPSRMRVQVMAPMSRMGTGATVGLQWGVHATVTVRAAGSGYATAPTVAIAPAEVNWASAAASMKAVSAGVAVPGTGYVIGNTITLTGGTSTTATILTVSALRVVGVPAIVGAGAGYSANQILTLSGGTLAAGGAKATIKVLTVNGSGAIQTLALESAGNYSAIPAGAVAVEEAGGATFTLTWGVDAVTVTTAGSYTVLPTVPIA